MSLRLVIIHILMIFVISCHDCREEKERLYLNTSFTGIVSQAYFDSKHRGAAVVQLIDNRRINIGAKFLICFAQNGDSIFKFPGSLRYKLKSKDKIMFFYPGCDEGFIDIDTVYSYNSFDYSKGTKYPSCYDSKREYPR